MPKTNLAQSATKKKMAYVRGMMAGGQAQQGSGRPCPEVWSYGENNPKLDQKARKNER